MSGIAGVVALDGGPVDAVQVRRMTDALVFRGPDGAGTRVDGAAGLGHALLAPVAAPGTGTGPLVMDGVWIAADARLDARGDLLRELRGAGRRPEAGESDAALILHAYHAWGPECVHRLLGDFAFALWDAPRRRLLCARDHFGIRPFFYAVAGARVVFGNTLQALLLHPGVGYAPADQSVGDFLVFGWNRDPAATFFEGIRTLPPAHTLVAEDGRVRAARYWTLPVDDELRYRRAGEYLEHFEEVMGAALTDRVPTGSASLFMSGGRDSTALAATLRRVHGDAVHLRAHTAVYDRLMPDEERHYSAIAAQALGIPIEHHAVDDIRLLEGWERPELRRPQPVEMYLGLIDARILRAMLPHGRTVLTGFAADAAFYGPRSRLVKLALGLHPLQALREAVQYAYWHRRIPRPGVRTWLRDRGGRPAWTPPFPAWLNPALEERFGFRAALEADLRPPPSPHPRRPGAYDRVTSPYWARLFEGFDPGASGLPIQVAHPYLDVRLVRFLLALPPTQWLNDKGLLRATLARQLPAGFLRRQKTPLAGDPIAVRLREWGPDALARRTLAPGIGRYVDAARLPAYAGGTGPDAPLEDAWLHLRPLALSVWLDPEGASA